jgi:hypothetical protein
VSLGVVIFSESVGSKQPRSTVSLSSKEDPPMPRLGNTEPRLRTEPLRPLTPETSLGYAAIEFIEGPLGQTLLPWQRWWLIHALELREDGKTLRYRTIVTLVARQNGKTTLLKYLTLFFLFTGRAKLILGTAQSLSIAREVWQGCVELLDDSPELNRGVVVRRANGQQAIELPTGARYRIAASNKKASRGLTVHLLIVDELREHTAFDAWAALSKTTTATKGLKCAISNAGSDESVVLNDLREKALAGTDPSLGLFEWSAPDDCALDDLDALAAANPGLGYPGMPDEEQLLSDVLTGPAAVVRTETLCQRVPTLGDMAVGKQDWADCKDTSLALKDLGIRVAMCVDISPDMAHATLSVAGVGEDGRVRVEVPAAWEGPNAARQMVADLAGWKARIKPRAFGYFMPGPTAAVKVDLDKLGAAPIQADVNPACQALAELVTGRQLVHGGDPLLTAHVLGAKKYPVGEGWRFVRKGAGHCDGAYAAAGAVHLARTLPPEKKVVVLVPTRRSA